MPENLNRWIESIAGVVHENSDDHYFVILRASAASPKMQFPFLQDKHGVVWHVQEQRVSGWLKKQLLLNLCSRAGSPKSIVAIASQDAVDRAPGSALRWIEVAAKCQSAVTEAPVVGIFAGMDSDFFWKPSDPQRLIAESNERKRRTRR